MAPLTLWVCAMLAPLAARGALVSQNAGTACRATTNESQQCKEGVTQNCSHIYDVLTGIQSVDGCKQVCDRLAGSCHGMEYMSGNGGGRCEIWKVPIEATIQVTHYECFKQVPAPTGTDGTLYLEINLTITAALNTSAVNSSTSLETVSGLVRGAVQSGFVDQYSMNNVSLSASAVSVVASVDALNTMHAATVTLTPAAPAGALGLYAMLRTGNDFKDGTPSGVRTALKSSLESKLQAAIGMYLASGAITVQIGERALVEAPQPTSPPTSASASASSSLPLTSSPPPTSSFQSTTNASRDSSGAEGFRWGLLPLASAVAALAVSALP